MLKLNISIEEMFIKIPNDLWKDKDLYDLDFVVYCMILRRCTMREYSPISVTDIYNMLRLNNRNYLSDIKQSLVNLSNSDMIGCYNQEFVECDLEVVKPSDTLYVVTQKQEDTFFQVYENELIEIIRISNQTKSRMSFIRYAIALYRVTNNQNLGNKKIGFLTKKTVGFIVKDASTVKLYNELLKTNNLFYYTTNYINNKTKKNTPTYFGRASSMTLKEFNDDMAKIMAENTNILYVSSERQSDVRSSKSKTEVCGEDIDFDEFDLE